MSDMIEIGDRVKLMWIYPNGYNIVRFAKVTHVPQGEGDVWEVKYDVYNIIAVINIYHHAFHSMEKL